MKIPSASDSNFFTTSSGFSAISKRRWLSTTCQKHLRPQQRWVRKAFFGFWLFCLLKLFGWEISDSSDLGWQLSTLRIFCNPSPRGFMYPTGCPFSIPKGYPKNHPGPWRPRAVGELALDDMQRPGRTTNLQPNLQPKLDQQMMPFFSSPQNLTNIDDVKIWFPFKAIVGPLFGREQSMISTWTMLDRGVLLPLQVWCRCSNSMVPVGHQRSKRRDMFTQRDGSSELEAVYSTLVLKHTTKCRKTKKPRKEHKGMYLKIQLWKDSLYKTGEV